MLSAETAVAEFPAPGSFALVPRRNMRRVRIIRINADGTVYVQGPGETTYDADQGRIVRRAPISLTIDPADLRPDLAPRSRSARADRTSRPDIRSARA